MGIRKITRMALLTAIALTIFVAEAQLPAPVPIYGVKLGLANIVTVWAVFLLGPLEAAMILLARVVLGALVTGQMMALMYSLGGGALCLCAMIPLSRVLTEKQMKAWRALGAVSHTVTQALAADPPARAPARGAVLPGMVGMPQSLARALAQSLSPMLPRIWDGGPMNKIPAFSQARANSGFSDRKP